MDYEIDKNGCWLWKRNLRKGYARVGGKRKSAHITFWEEVNGPVPDGLELDHLCRNKACVNPNHLEAVTHATNLRRGSRTKLTMGQVMEIREMAGGITQKELGKMFGVSEGTINRIVCCRGWL